MQLTGMSLIFSRSSEQETELQRLLVAQQDPASPLYHGWLTPEQFGARFGISDEDLAKAETWLQQQGFSIDRVTRSRDRILFSGTVAQVEAAFGTEIHNFTLNGATHFAPATDLSVPAALASITQAVSNLSSFRPHSQLRRPEKMPTSAPSFTSATDQAHYLTPGDISTIYDISPAYNAGYTGSGQSIAVVGQSAIVLSDIENFQKAAGLTVKDPSLVLVPNSGTSTVASKDENESDLDLEYSGAIAPGATIDFVYVGNNPNDSVTDSEAYAVDNDIAPVISISYGLCELELDPTEYAAQNSVFEQAAAQGQTVVAAAGDDGSSGCADDDQGGLSVDFPASSQYVTGLGGTEFPYADVEPLNTEYWETATSSDVISSARSYIPEQVWNDSTAADLAAGGGGVSIYTARPSWQTGVAGISAGTYRMVPDVSLSSSPDNAGYLYCSSDTATDITGSCSHGFRDSTDLLLTVAGGTSFAAPIFSGMVAILNQAMGTSGQGLINMRLYTLASNSTTYARAFHDITSGDNACAVGYLYCSSAAQGEYPATTGYDEATGLGSVDFNNLLTAWTSSTDTPGPPFASTTTLTAATTDPDSGVPDSIIITVASGSSASSATPTGTVSVAVDGAAAGTLTLSGGKATYTFSSTMAGTHTVTATYSGDSVFAVSSGSITVTVPAAATPAPQPLPPTFSISATNVSITAGNSGTSTVTLTPGNGYTGTVQWSLAALTSLSNACYSISDTTVSGAKSVATILTIYTSASACANLTPFSQPEGRHAFTPVARAAGGAPGEEINARPANAMKLAFALFGLFGFGVRRTRRMRPCAALLLLISLAITLTGCAANNESTVASPTNHTSTASGSYTLVLTGQDSASSSLSASTSLTLTVQ